MAILISTPQDLHNIRNNLAADYELTNNIDLSDWGNWTPIENFAGTINGKGHVIKNLTILNAPYAGLIGRTSSTFTVRNLGFKDININADYYNVGALVSYTNGQNVVIESCFVDGGSIYARGYAGALIGNLRGTVTVKNCYAIMDSIYTSQYRSSGLIGIIVGDTHNVKDCYTVTKSLDCIDKNEIYGFTYSTTNPTVNNCFWDKEISGVTGSSFGTGLTTSEMKNQSNYTNWDFQNIWGINGNYPYLQVFGVPSAPAKKETVTVNSHVNKITANSTKQIKSTQQLQSYISTIQTNTERHTATIRSVEGYLSRINSNATQAHRSVRTGNRNVDSFVLPIGTSVHKESKTIKQLLSYVRPLQAYVSVLHPLRDIPTHAVVSTQENPSVSSQNENMSNIFCIQNPSNVEVI